MTYDFCNYYCGTFIRKHYFRKLFLLLPVLMACKINILQQWPAKVPTPD